ncbi:uncharacterized protein LOC100210178 isoform X2 [Hydra vulgaris]|uniref:uncharacterized protein LOC100210178 isoform X2 n=1 Tax=Hydra vulgaris TaxID=6087 RepID=UPI000640D359|nr:uncharacterized protein LOC100210178 isoform X2 [Hydra vulgaris]
MKELCLLIILIRLWSVNGVGITRNELGDESDNKAVSCPMGTLIIYQDETFSIHCFTSMKNEGCDLMFIGGNANVGFIPANNKNKTFDVISTCENNYSLKVANLTIQDYPTNTNHKVWTSYGIEVIQKFLNVQSLEKDKISLIFSGWSAGVFLKIQFQCINDEGSIAQDNDRLCVYFKFAGYLKYPLIDNFNKPTYTATTLESKPTYTATTFVSTPTYTTLTLNNTSAAFLDISTTPLVTYFINFTQMTLWKETTSSLVVVHTRQTTEAGLSSRIDTTAVEFAKTPEMFLTPISMQLSAQHNNWSKTKTYILIGVLLASFFLIIVFIVVLILRRKKKWRENNENVKEHRGTE